MFDLEVKSNPGSRMQIVGFDGLMHPATCMVCGSGNREGGYLRLGVYFDYEGEMYICIDFCLTELINTVGGLTRDEAVTVYTAANNALERVAQLEAELEYVNGRLVSYDALLSGIRSDVTYVPPSEHTELDEAGEPQARVNPAKLITVSDGEQSKSFKPVKGVRLIDPSRLNGGDGSTIEGHIEL